MAAMLDSGLLLLIFVPLFLWVYVGHWNNERQVWLPLVAMGLPGLFCVLDMMPRGTVGKRFVGVTVIGHDGGPVPFGRMAVRSLLKWWVSMLSAFIVVCPFGPGQAPISVIEAVFTYLKLDFSISFVVIGICSAAWSIGEVVFFCPYWTSQFP